MRTVSEPSSICAHPWKGGHHTPHRPDIPIGNCRAWSGFALAVVKKLSTRFGPAQKEVCYAVSESVEGDNNKWLSAATIFFFFIFPTEPRAFAALIAVAAKFSTKLSSLDGTWCLLKWIFFLFGVILSRRPINMFFLSFHVAIFCDRD